MRGHSTFLCESLESRRMLFATGYYTFDDVQGEDSSVAPEWNPQNALALQLTNASVTLALPFPTTPDHNRLHIQGALTGSLTTPNGDTDRFKIKVGGQTVMDRTVTDWQGSEDSLFDLDVPDQGGATSVEFEMSGLESGEWWNLISLSISAHRPTVAVIAADARASENNCDPASFAISLDEPKSTETKVYFALGGSATPGESTDPDADYVVTGATKAGTQYYVTIPASGTGATVTVTPLNDARNDEGVETIDLTLQSDPASYYGNPTSNPVTAPAEAHVDLHNLKITTHPNPPSAQTVRDLVDDLDNIDPEVRESAQSDLALYESEFTSVTDPILDGALNDLHTPDAKEHIKYILTPVKVIPDGNKITISLRSWGGEGHTLQPGQSLQVQPLVTNAAAVNPPPLPIQFTGWDDNKTVEIEQKAFSADGIEYKMDLDIVTPNQPLDHIVYHSVTMEAIEQ